MSSWTQKPFAEALPALLEERGMSIRALARLVEVSDAHLSRVLRGANYKTVSPDLARRVAESLGLDEGFFPETRAGVVVERVHDDPVFRDKLYKQLRRKQ